MKINKSMQNYNIDMKIDQHKHNKENNLLQSRLRVAENTSKSLVKNHHKHTEKNNRSRKRFTWNKILGENASK